MKKQGKPNEGSRSLLLNMVHSLLNYLWYITLTLMDIHYVILHRIVSELKSSFISFDGGGDWLISLID